MPARSLWTHFGLLVVLAIAAIALTFRLSSSAGFPDEWETSLLAREILESGVPRVPQDGSWHYPFVFRWVDETGLWIWSPWLDEYVAAAGMWIGGPDLGSARAPFVIAAILAVVLIYFLARRVYGKWQVGLLAVLFLVTTPMFLGLARQSRYYSLAVLGEVWLLWGVHQALTGRTIPAGANMLLATLVQFFTNYIFVAVNALALVVVALLGIRTIPALFRAGAFIIAPGLLITAGPWLWMVRHSVSGDFHGMTNYLDIPPDHTMRPLTGITSKVWQSIAAINDSVLPIVFILAAILTAILVRRTNSSSSDSFDGSKTRWFNVTLITLVVANIAVLSLTHIVTPRYFLILCPAMALLVSAWLVNSGLPRKAVWGLSVLFIFLQLFLNPLRFCGEPGVPNHVEGLIGNWITQFSPTQVAADYINRNAKPGDRVLTIGDCLGLKAALPHQQFICAESRDLGDDFLPEWVMTDSPSGMDHNVYAPLPKKWRSLYEEVVLTAPRYVGDDMKEVPFRLYRGRCMNAPGSSPTTVSPNGEPYRLVDTVEVRRPAWRLISPWGASAQGAHLAVVPGSPDLVRVIPGHSVSRQDCVLRHVAIAPDRFLGGGFHVQSGSTYLIRFVVDSVSPNKISVGLREVGQPHAPLSGRESLDLQAGRQTVEMSFKPLREAEAASLDFFFDAPIVETTIGHLEIARTEWSVSASRGAKARLTVPPGGAYLRAAISEVVGDPFSLTLSSPNFKVRKGQAYRVLLRLRSDDRRPMFFTIAQRSAPYQNVGCFHELAVPLGGSELNFSFTAAMDEEDAHATLALGAHRASVDLLEFRIEQSATTQSESAQDAPSTAP